MTKKKQFKCRFSHCEHPDKLILYDDVVKSGSSYWHKDCYEISQTIQEIIKCYVENISNTVVMSLLRKTINTLIFEKLHDKNLPKCKSDLLAARYLLFAVKFAVSNHIPLKSPLGMHYLIDNHKIKEAWKKKNDIETKKQVSAKIDFSATKQTTFSVKNNVSGFDALFGECLANE